VKAVTHRYNPIWRTTVGPGEEHVNMAGIPTEASILDMVGRAMPGKLLNVFAHSAGGGKLLAVMQFKKAAAVDEGRQRQAALLAFAAFPELKHVILVDEDVDIFDSDDVLWAMQTRYQGDVDTITIPAFAATRSIRRRSRNTARAFCSRGHPAKRSSTARYRSI
jgi:4-hydroxy-3-polyprenylbenzoate decarboxylase